MKFYNEWSGWKDDLDTFDLRTRVQSECRPFRNNIPQFCQSAKNHSAKKTFGNATIWQNNSAKNIRKLVYRKQFIWKPDNWQLIFGKS